jgi:hypothetical protein
MQTTCTTTYKPVLTPQELLIKERNRYRQALHNDIIRRIKTFNLIDTPEVIERVKRVFLLKVMKVETSKALDIGGLKLARTRINEIKRDDLLSMLLDKYPEFTPRDYYLLSQKQRNKIVRILKYVMQLDSLGISTYVESSIGRYDWCGHVTMNEADKIIKRAEKWEAKQLTNGRK